MKIGQIDLFVLQPTLTFPLALLCNLDLHNRLPCINSNYWQFEVFDHLRTLTFDLQLNLTLVNSLKTFCNATITMKIWGISPSNNLDFDIFNNFTKFWYAQVIFMEKKTLWPLMNLTLEFDLDLSENFTTWYHCIVSYYEQFEVFDLKMTLKFDLQTKFDFDKYSTFCYEYVVIMVYMRYLTVESPWLRYLTLKWLGECFQNYVMSHCIISYYEQFEVNNLDCWPSNEFGLDKCFTFCHV